MAFCEVVGMSSEIRRNIPPVLDGVACNRHGELRLLADKCLRCIFCILCSSVQLAVVFCVRLVFLMDEIPYKQM